MSCKVCEKLHDMGITDPVVAIEHQMLWQNVYIKHVVSILGSEKATVLGQLTELEVEKLLPTKEAADE